MPATVSSIVIPRVKRFSYQTKKGEVEYGLSTGPVLEDGKPKVYVTWWDAFIYLAEKGLKLPTLYETLLAAGQDPEIKNSVFSFPTEWQNHLILPENADIETDEYVLKNRSETKFRKSNRARVLKPVEIHEDADRKIVIADAFTLKFELRSGYYNGLKDFDPESGFLRRIKDTGNYYVWFGSDNRLYAVLLDGGGGVGCGWGPGRSGGTVGFRGRSTGNIPQELLDSDLEVPVEVPIEIETDYRRAQRARPKKPVRQRKTTKPRQKKEPEKTKPKIPKEIIDNGMEDLYKRASRLDLD